MKKIGIICAGDTELEPYLEIFSKCIVQEKAMLKFYTTTFAGKIITMLYSGVCKVNASIATQILIDTFKVDTIINSGVAGGIDKNLKLFDTVVATESIYHDVAEDILTDFHPWLESNSFKSDKFLVEKLEELKEEKIYFGTVVTGEKFIVQDEREEIIKRFNPLAVDMETTAIAHTCYVNKIPFVAIRSITDTEDENGIENFEKNCKKASTIARDITLKLIEKI